MTKWERQRKRDEAKRKKAAAERRTDLKATVKLLSKLLSSAKEYTTWQKIRANAMRKCLDVLAGEAAMP